MLWDAFFFYILSNLVVCKGYMDSKKYCKLVMEEILPFAAENFGKSFYFSTRWHFYTSFCLYYEVIKGLQC